MYIAYGVDIFSRWLCGTPLGMARPLLVANGLVLTLPCWMEQAAVSLTAGLPRKVFILCCPSSDAATSDRISKRSGTWHCNTEQQTLSTAQLCGHLGKTKPVWRGSEQGHGWPRDCLCIFLGSLLPSHRLHIFNKLTINNEWTSTATAANKCRFDTTDTAGEWIPFQPPWQEMHCELFFFSFVKIVVC